MTNGDLFDPAYYANRYPDVASAVGNDKYALLEHYLQFGEKEGRSPNQLDEEAKLAKLYEEEHKNDNQQSSGNTNTNQNGQQGSLGPYAAGTNLTATDNGNGTYTITDANGNTVGSFDSGNDTLTAASGTYDLPVRLTSGFTSNVNLGMFQPQNGAVVNVTATAANSMGLADYGLKAITNAGNGSTITANDFTISKTAANGTVVSTPSADAAVRAITSGYTKPTNYTVSYTPNGGQAAMQSTATITVAPDPTQGGKSIITVSGLNAQNTTQTSYSGTISSNGGNVTGANGGPVTITLDDGHTITIDASGLISYT